MEEHNIKICRLCLNIIESENFEVLEELRAEMLRTLLNNFNPFVSYNPIICGNCNNSLQKCYDFKMICLNNQDCAKAFINVNDPLKVNLEDVRELFEDGKKREGKKMCRLCFSLNSGYFVNMNEVIDDKSVANMLMSCIPELNLDMTNEPSVCQPCIYLLKRQLTFMQHCLKLEEKVNLYCKLKRKNNFDVVDLYDVRQFFEKIQPENSNERNIPIQENEINPPTEVVCIKVENVEMEAEDNSENVDTYRTEENMNLPNPAVEENINLQNPAVEESTNTVDELQNPAVEESTNTVGEQSNSKSDITNSDKKFNCSKCSYTAKYKYALRSHLLTHKSPSEITMYQCTTCGHETKRRGDLKAHMIIHKNPSELQMFKCTICTYESRRKVDLKNHMYTHSTEPFKCKYCPFESKNFHSVTKHMVVHKGKHSFNCLHCPYVSKNKQQFVEHSQKHESPSKRRMFQCISCKFETHSKKNLKKHIVVHKDIPENEMFTCYTCNFKCKRKKYLIKHMLIHNNPSEVVYNCKQCSYTTKRPRYFTNHLKSHKDLSEVQTFSCTMCNFRTRWKRSLTDHMFQHVSHPEVIHKCEKCSYSTKIPRNLNRHIKRLHS